MSYQGALDFIRTGRDRGLSDEDIAQRLRGAGWRHDDVRDAFALLASMGRVPEPVARLASTPVVMRQPVVHAEPMEQPSPEQSARIESAPEQSAQPVQKKAGRSTSMRWVLWLLLVIGAFVLGYLVM